MLKRGKQKKKKMKEDNDMICIFVLQHKGCLHNVPVYRLVLGVHRIMARRTSFSGVE